MAYLSSMRLRIDGSEVSWDPSALPTFGEVVEEAGKRAAAGGRIISRVVVEGREISTRLEREIADRPPGGLGEFWVADVSRLSTVFYALSSGGVVPALGVIGLFVGPVILAVTYTLMESWGKDIDRPPAPPAKGS